MRPLKILAFVIGAVPIAAFLLTLFLTDGAPLRPLTPGDLSLCHWPGEESEPVAATRALPLVTPERTPLERQGRVTAAGYSSIVGFPALHAGEMPPRSATLVNHDRDVLLFMTLFGVPNPYLPPSP